jgi:aminoglycoside 6-adenylyltransferase
MWARWYGPTVERFRKWAESEPDVRAAFIVGSQARGETPADEWSDLDLVICHNDPGRLIASTDWFQLFGTVVLSMVERTAVLGGRERRVLYSDGRDVDFAVFPAWVVPLIVNSPEAQAVLGRGYVVLVDKDRQFDRFEQPVVGRPEPPRPPTREQYQDCVADFWYHLLWTAKKIGRGEVWTAKMGLDGHLKYLLLRMLEWQTVSKGGRDVDVWHDGRFLDQWAEPWVRRRLPLIFAQYDRRDEARALAETGRLFSEVAREVAATMKWSYPMEAEQALWGLSARVLKKFPGPA